MKALLAVLVALGFAQAAEASGTTCSSYRLHYSHHRLDRGIAPRKGDKLSGALLTLNGDILGKAEYFEDAPTVGTFDWTVKLSKEKVLATTGNRTVGSRIFYATLSADMDGGPDAGISERVLCEESWAYVP